MITPTWKTFRNRIRSFYNLPSVRSNRLGFTLLELLLAISLMGLMLGLSLPRIGAVKTAYFATEEAKEVANIVRATRMDAVASRTTTGLIISPGRPTSLQRHRLQIQPWFALGETGFVGERKDRQEVWKTPIVSRLDISNRIELESTESGIMFFANGSSSGGEILLKNDKGEQLHHFLVVPSTGELLVQK